MKLSDHDLRLISGWNKSLSGSVELELRTSEDPRSGELEDFARRLRDAADRVQVVVQAENRDRFPAFQIGAGWVYHGVPSGRELQPFLRILAFNGAVEASVTASVATFLDEVDRPALLRLCVAPHCVHCPHVVNALAPLPFHNQHLQIELYDVLMFPEIPKRYRIKAVPVLLYGDHFRWTGTIHLQEVLKVVAQDDPTRLDTSALVQMLKEGNAEKLAEMMVASGSIFPALLDVLVHPEWSVRLGAMVAAEAIGEQDPKLAATLLEPLWERRTALEKERIGDIVYLIGELGGSDWIPRLESLRETTVDSDLREVVCEALATLASRRSM